MPRAGEKNTEKDKGDHAGNAGGEAEKSDEKKPFKKYQSAYGRNRNNRNWGKNRHYSGGDRRHFKRPKYDVGERLKEVDLSITEYVAKDIEGFTGTIKERFTDFVVHEINLNGEIAKLDNDEIPPEPEDLQSIDDLKKKVPEDIWNQLQTITEDNAGVEIDVTDVDRTQRKYIHEIVKKLLTVTSETKDVNNRKVIVFSKAWRNKGRDNRQDWSSRGGDYCHFILHKVNMDTMDALNQLSKVLRVKSSIFNYAGTKDRRAKTTQWISVKKMNPKTIMNASRAVKGAYVGNFKFEKEPLKLGKLDGNRFTIALRNVSASDELIEKAMTSLRDNGFINYYGLQRFGTIAAIPTYEIGKALLQGNWLEAIDLILKPREGEQDTHLSEAREIFKNTKDARAAYQKIGRNDKIEAKLLWGINVCGLKNPLGALDMVPRNTTLMYVHAYQSIVWNKVVSRRIKEFGLKPIVGDLVYENPDVKDESETVHEDVQHVPEEDGKNNPDTKESADDSEQNVDKAEKEESEKDSDLKDQQNTEKENQDSKTENNKSNEKDSNERELPKVKILTEEDLPNYTMADIIMPQPGWKVTYPTYAKTWFDEHLEKDGLTPELKQKNKKYTLSGSYRKILQIPKDLSWKIIHYANKTDDLIRSDIDEMKGVEPPKDNPEGTFKALVIQMSLKSSAYATMALREVLKCDTSSQTHAAQSAAFQAAHEKNEEAKKIEQNKNAESSEAEENNQTENPKDNGDASLSTEDESNDKKANVSTASSALDESVVENGSKSDEINNSVSKDENLKHETDAINDSGIEPGTVIHT